MTVKNEDFNDKNIFTRKYEKQTHLNKIEITQDDKDKFIKMNEDNKLKIVEDLLNAVSKNEQMEENLNKITKEITEFKKEMERINSGKVIVDRNKNWDVNEEANVYSSNIMIRENEINDELFMDLFEISTNLKDILNEIPMSQAYLCKKTGINRSTLSYLMSNPETVTLKNAYKIAKILKRPIEDIFSFGINVNEK